MSEVSVRAVHDAMVECAFCQVRRDERGWFYRIVFLPSFELIDPRRFGSRNTAKKRGEADLKAKRAYYAEHGTVPSFSPAEPARMGVHKP